MSSLSTLLFREVRPDFFRILSGPLARLYVDVLDALECEASRRNQGLDREEALALIQQVVETQFISDGNSDDPVNQASTALEKSRLILETLRSAGWVYEEERSDWQRIVHFDSNSILLMQALRKIAAPDAAVFSDKLVNVCTTLANQNLLTEQPWAQIESCTENLKTGLAELRSMQKSIERHTKQQLATTTLKENLSILFDQFAERIGRTCYAQLVHARLPSKLSEARHAVEDMSSNADLLGKMQTEVMRRDSRLSPETAMAHVRLRLNDLEELLNQVEPLADVIDRRTSEFTRRSQARFRYLQETTSENRSQAQTFFEILNRHFAGKKLSDLNQANIGFPALWLHDARIIGGMESLYTPRLRREAGEIEPLADLDGSLQDRTLAQLGSNMRESLTVIRANRFVQALPGKSGAHISSTSILNEHIHTEDDIADLIACLLHSRSRDARYEIRPERIDKELDSGEFDDKFEYRIERFMVIKK
jgi:hypothetical protein